MEGPVGHKTHVLGYMLETLELPEDGVLEPYACPRCGTRFPVEDDWRLTLDSDIRPARKGVDAWRTKAGVLLVSKRFVEAIGPLLGDTASVQPRGDLEGMWEVHIHDEVQLDKRGSGLSLGRYCTHCDRYSNIHWLGGPSVAGERELSEGLHRADVHVARSRPLFVGPATGRRLLGAGLTGLNLVEYTGRPRPEEDCRNDLAGVPSPASDPLCFSLRRRISSPDSVPSTPTDVRAAGLARVSALSDVLVELWHRYADAEWKVEIEQALALSGDSRSGELRADRVLESGWESERLSEDCALLFGWNADVAETALGTIVEQFEDHTEMNTQIDACLWLRGASSEDMVSRLGDDVRKDSDGAVARAFVSSRPNRTTVAAAKEMMSSRSTDDLRLLAAKHLSQDWLPAEFADEGVFTAVLDSQEWANDPLVSAECLKAAGYVLDCERAPRFAGQLKYVYLGTAADENWQGRPRSLPRASTEERVEIENAVIAAADMISLRSSLGLT